MSLYRAETRRLMKRRFTKVLAIGCLAILAALAVGTFFTNQKVGPAAIAAAQARANEDYQNALRDTEQQKQQCVAAQGTERASDFPPNCEEITPPSQDDFRYEWYMPATFSFRTNFPEMVLALAGILAMGAFVIGASFVGAEWSSGGMMNLLLWRPQRVRVLGTKLAALLAGIGAFTVVVSAVWTGLFLLIAALRGSTAGMTSGAWQSIMLLELRAVVLVVAAAALGFGLASLGRHTAVALGVTVGVIVVFQFGLATVLALARVKFIEAYLIPVWADAWLSKQVRLEDYESCNFSATQGCMPDTLTITWQMAGGVLAAVLVLVVGAAMWTIRSRDVT
ncbi:ABC-type transport system involved in multi-copper enzyme maturation permease subunit [Krasilnikovia cinnamomea]|uniref:ABC-type transport system involved in multi-copper enzyme maturation permease subunit n=1 Tax=Krasilnikovia cinnamomea TaxID=349313 RepID=A0A4Q7ZI57_9ACTN|nr:ABC transporter permease subunit [Krasilnikovia cinnamomea]RZU50540.1 ABC-type transport system involved in multi-copper enzyme maturation permease subunit [Krasilnikovia cinnamomea]